MPSVLPAGQLRVVVGGVIVFLLVCPAFWSHEVAAAPSVLPWRWHKQFPAQLTSIDLTWEGHTVALTVTPLKSGEDNRLHVYDASGRELWSLAQRARMLGASLSADGAYLAIGLMDFSIAMFSRRGELLWERQSIGLPRLTADGEFLIAFNSGIGGQAMPLVEIFRRDGGKAWSLQRRGRVWRAVVSDRNDLLVSLWNGEVLLIDRHQRLLWQQLFTKEVLALTMSPGDARYFAVATGVGEQGLHLYERPGRPLWRRTMPSGVTDISLAPEGAFLVSYGNTVHGQHLALYNRSGDVQWTYHLTEPAAESSKAVIVPRQSIVVAGVEREGRSYLQGFALHGELLWLAPVPDPIFDFQVSRDGRYIAAATDHAVYFFDTQAAPSSTLTCIPADETTLPAGADTATCRHLRSTFFALEPERDPLTTK
jgi:outer membrane protein assembly factor BamB